MSPDRARITITSPTSAQRAVLDLLADGADHNLYEGDV
jgi:hypothetical protein